jgi:hypothetical protein
MTTEEITRHLEAISSSDDFPSRSTELTDAWSASGAGLEIVDPILRFMEKHPSLDYGMPGALVHFLERFYGKGYEDKLIKSIQRRPTLLTVWMLNRMINGTKDPATRHLLIATMEETRLHPMLDQKTLNQVNGFLERLSD